MGFSLVWDLSASSHDGSIVLDFAISQAVRREPEKFPGLPDGLEVKVLRKEIAGFRYVKHREEFLLTEDFSDAKAVFSGKPERKTENLFRYTDETVEKGRVYDYWLTTDMNERPLGPVPVRCVDNDVIWTHERTMTECRRIAERYPGVTMKDHGHSVRGRRLVSLSKGNMENAVVVIAGVHAAEAGQFTALDIFERYCALDDGRMFKKTGMAVMPSVNPDESERMAKGHTAYLRKNGAGVDLNRNFPADWDTVSDMYGLSTADPVSSTYRGPWPSSEPETRAVLDFFADLDPAAVFSLHCYPGGITFDQLFGPGAASDDNEYKKSCLELTKAYSKGFRRGEYPDEIFLAFGTTPGSLPLWIYREYGVPAFDVEAYDYYVRKHPMAMKACNFNADVPMMEELSKRHFHGILGYMNEVIEK